MKSICVFATALIAIVSCNASPTIGPDPIDASTNETSSSSSSASSASSSTSSSSSSASSGGGPQGDGSGGRLKRYVHISTDGLRAPVSGTYYDSALGIDCWSQVTAAGRRCMPLGAAAMSSYFADMQCSTAAVVITKDCAVASYAFKYAAALCGAFPEMAVYHTTTAPLAAVYELSANGCEDVSAKLLPYYNIYAVGLEVDYAQFAPMTLEHE